MCDCGCGLALALAQAQEAAAADAAGAEKPRALAPPQARGWESLKQALRGLLADARQPVAKAA